MAELAWPYGATALDAVGEDSGAEILVKRKGLADNWGKKRGEMNAISGLPAFGATLLKVDLLGTGGREALRYFSICGCMCKGRMDPLQGTGIEVVAFMVTDENTDQADLSWQQSSLRGSVHGARSLGVWDEDLNKIHWEVQHASKA